MKSGAVMPNRRQVTATLALALASPGMLLMPASRTKAAGSLLSAPLSLQGKWGEGWNRKAIVAALGLAREACLEGVRLVSDRQPASLIVRNKPDPGTPPSIWLHKDRPDTAIVILAVGAQDWSRLTYQFGHELGHVLANSWQVDANPRPPCQWLEEALVEAFSLRGMRRVARLWQEEPPFEGAAELGTQVGDYGAIIASKHQEVADEQGAARFRTWLRRNRSELEAQTGLSGPAYAAVTTMLAQMEKRPSGVDDLGALNRWPERSSLRLEDYLARWEQSCAELGASGRLANRVKRLLVA